jgi:hypothetical protein
MILQNMQLLSELVDVIILTKSSMDGAGSPCCCRHGGLSQAIQPLVAHLIC